MAEDMIERAARAIATTQIPAFKDPKIWAEDLPHYRRRDERFKGAAHLENPIGMARSALLAGLDVSNDKKAFQVLVTALAIADDGHPEGLKYHEQAKAALLALHDHIGQGVSVSQEQVREKD